VPLAYWSAAVPIRALAVTGQGNINVTALSTTITPQSTPLPSPTFGTPGGSITSVTLPVADTIPTAVIRYAIDMAITSGSPTITNGSSITVTAP
jgi:ABC-type cobalt transport system substrate-binding protein